MTSASGFASWSQLLPPWPQGPLFFERCCPWPLASLRVSSPYHPPPTCVAQCPEPMGGRAARNCPGLPREQQALCRCVCPGGGGVALALLQSLGVFAQGGWQPGWREAVGISCSCGLWSCWWAWQDQPWSVQWKNNSVTNPHRLGFQCWLVYHQWPWERVGLPGRGTWACEDPGVLTREGASS